MTRRYLVLVQAAQGYALPGAPMEPAPPEGPDPPTMHHAVLVDDALDALLRLYHPGVPEGNFQADVASRGGNRTLSKAIVALGLATADEVAARFAELDAAHCERSEARLAKINAGASA